MINIPENDSVEGCSPRIYIPRGTIQSILERDMIIESDTSVLVWAAKENRVPSDQKTA